MVEFQCTSCDQPINANDKYAGKIQLNTQYAGFWKRFLAFCIDGTILIVVGIFFSTIITTVMISRVGTSGTDPKIIYIISTCTHLTISSIIQLLYFTILESSHLQATPGKTALDIIVTDETGNRISFMQANGRFFAKTLSTITLFIGFMMVGFTERKQALHDIIAGTYVINKTNSN